MRELRTFLGMEGYVLLSACAVYPGLYWLVTVHLSADMVRSGRADPVLLRLCRLPWFRAGGMPDWLRLTLLTNMPHALEQRTRESLQRLLSRISSDGSAEDRLPHASLGQSLWQRWRRSLGGRHRPISDHVFCAFMTGLRPDRLSLPVPRLLQEWLFRHGDIRLGPRAGAFILTMTLAALVWYAPLPGQVESPVGTPVGNAAAPAELVSLPVQPDATLPSDAVSPSPTPSTVPSRRAGASPATRLRPSQTEPLQTPRAPGSIRIAAVGEPASAAPPAMLLGSGSASTLPGAARSAPAAPPPIAEPQPPTGGTTLTAELAVLAILTEFSRVSTEADLNAMLKHWKGGAPGIWALTYRQYLSECVRGFAMNVSDTKVQVDARTASVSFSERPSCGARPLPVTTSRAMRWSLTEVSDGIWKLVSATR
jgi:hypothetical protein